MKTRKSISKRFKFTKSGKVLCRPVGQDHFRVKKSGEKIRKTRQWIELDKTMAKKIKKMMKYAPRKIKSKK
ncbi:MAG: 50S ribosomal protein L35 [Candidatus Bathyarchaeota archaeon]|nr:50S ribosomal protein L35 [Candidatus Bathyarchaeota archaeon]